MIEEVRREEKVRRTIGARDPNFAGWNRTLADAVVSIFRTSIGSGRVVMRAGRHSMPARTMTDLRCSANHGAKQKKTNQGKRGQFSQDGSLARRISRQPYYLSIEPCEITSSRLGNALTLQDPAPSEIPGEVAMAVGSCGATRSGISDFLSRPISMGTRRGGYRGNDPRKPVNVCKK